MLEAVGGREESDPQSEMSRVLLLNPEARADVAAASTWYENQRPGLGVEFLAALEECLSRIQEHPLGYHPIHRQVRRVSLRRFPYQVYYTFRPEQVHIWAVLHGSRDPQEWRRRVR